MQVMIRIIKLERLIKIFSFLFDSLFEGIYKATSARGLERGLPKTHIPLASGVKMALRRDTAQKNSIMKNLCLLSASKTMPYMKPLMTRVLLILPFYYTSSTADLRAKWNPAPIYPDTNAG